MENKEIIKELEEAIVLNREARTKNNDAMCHAKNALMGGDCKITDSPVYKQGLEDAWKIASKIVLHESDGGYGVSTLLSIFGNEWVSDIFNNTSIHEVIKKIEAWEKKQEEQAKPKLGDVVKIYGGSGEFYHTGIFIEEEEKDYVILSKALHHTQSFSKINFRLEKTGKHFDIQNMLDEIG